jgi:cytochrome c-type biogenesis protein CcsB
MNLLLFKAVLGIYIVGTLGNLIYLASPREYLARSSLYIMAVGFALHLAWLVTRIYEAGHVPVTNMHESLSFFTLAVIGLYLILTKKFGVTVLGAFISPVAVVFMLMAAGRPSEVGTLPPILQSSWLAFHPVFSFFGNALFALAFGAGAMYLIQEKEVKSKKLGGIFRRLPSLEVLDEMNFYCLIFGFPLLTLGLLSGSIWAQAAWEVSPYSSLDAKVLWAAVTWLIYASLFSGRLLAGWRGKRAAVFALVGFGAVLLGYLVVSLYLSGQHTFIK